MDTFIGTIAIFGFNFTPRDWMPCNGQLISIASNSALFSLLGTNYGGDGINNFGLPDLRGRIVLGQGQGPGLNNYTVGQAGGTENTTLNISNLPAHSHQMMASSNPLSEVAASLNSLGSNPRGGTAHYASGNANLTSMGSPTSLVGQNSPFGIMQPFLTLNFCICVVGIFPSR